MAGSITLQVNQSVSFTTMIADSYGSATSAHTINYISSDPTVAVLANNGVFVQGSLPQNSVSTNTITAIKNGTAIITITIDGGIVINTINVSVNTPPPAEINFVFGTPQ